MKKKLNLKIFREQLGWVINKENWMLVSNSFSPERWIFYTYIFNSWSCFSSTKNRWSTWLYDILCSLLSDNFRTFSENVQHISKYCVGFCHNKWKWSLNIYYLQLKDFLFILGDLYTISIDINITIPKYMSRNIAPLSKTLLRLVCFDQCILIDVLWICCMQSKFWKCSSI